MRKKITLYGSLAFLGLFLVSFFTYQYFGNRYLADQNVLLTATVLPSMTLTSINIDDKPQSLNKNFTIDAMVGQKITFSGLMPANAKMFLFLDNEKLEITPQKDGNWTVAFRPNKINLKSGTHKISYYVADDRGFKTKKNNIGTLQLKDNTFIYSAIRFFSRS